MNEEKVNVISAEEDYSKNFMPKVHRIGRVTMLISLVLVFSPIIYYALIRGFTAPVSLYISAGLSICATGIGMWLSEPEACWPVLGSAGTYIAYLAGDVSSTRVPVAVACQKTADTDISSPKGQVITIYGLVASVVTKIIVLIIQVAVGTWIISKLPDAVTASFSFVVIGCVGAMPIMNTNGKAGFVKGLAAGLPYLVVSVVMWLLFNVATDWWAFSMIACVGSCVVLGYIFYRRDLKAAEAQK